MLNAYNTLCYTAGGFRTWWRRLYGTDADLDIAHLMRLAGRFARRVRGFAQAHGIPVVECGRGERKHRLAEEYLAAPPGTQGHFLIVVARAVAPVWEVTRSASVRPGGDGASPATPTRVVSTPTASPAGVRRSSPRAARAARRASSTLRPPAPAVPRMSSGPTLVTNTRPRCQ